MLRACLFLLLLSCAVSPVLAQTSRGAGTVDGCTSEDADSDVAPASQAVPAQAAHPATGSTRTPATRSGDAQSGGGGEDSLRPRMPRWNSFLPGMFR